MSAFAQQFVHKEQVLKRGRWAVLPYDLFKRYPEPLNFAEQLVIAHMYDFIKEGAGWNDCIPNQSVIADRMGATQSCISKVFSRLSRKGIVKSQRNRLASSYEFTLEWLNFVAENSAPVIPVGITSYSVGHNSPISTEVINPRSDEEQQQHKKNQTTLIPLDNEEGEGDSQCQEQDRREGKDKGKGSETGSGTRPSPPAQLRWPLMVAVAPGQNQSKAESKTKGEEMSGFSKSQQVGPRREKVKKKFGSTSKRKLSAYQSVHDSFCEVMASQGYALPSGHIPDKHIEECLSDGNSLEDVCQAVEFAVVNWDRLPTEIFPKGRFAPAPNLFEATHVWVVRQLKLYVANGGKAPVKVAQASVPQAPTASEAQPISEGRERKMREILKNAEEKRQKLRAAK